jgi:uncharacterized membrane protein
MDNNILKIIFRVVAVLLSLGALFFQLINFVFGTMVKNVSDMQDDYWYYGTELIPHLFTIIIIIWFVVFQIRKIINNYRYFDIDWPLALISVTLT